MDSARYLTNNNKNQPSIRPVTWDLRFHFCTGKGDREKFRPDQTRQTVSRKTVPNLNFKMHLKKIFEKMILNKVELNKICTYKSNKF